AARLHVGLRCAVAENRQVVSPFKVPAQSIPLALYVCVARIVLLLNWIQELRRHKLFAASRTGTPVHSRDAILLTDANPNVSVKKRDSWATGARNCLVAHVRLQKK